MPGMQDISSSTRDQPRPVDAGVLTAGLPGTHINYVFKKSIIDMFFIINVSALCMGGVLPNNLNDIGTWPFKSAIQH